MTFSEIDRPLKEKLGGDRQKFGQIFGAVRIEQRVLAAIDCLTE